MSPQRRNAATPQRRNAATPQRRNAATPQRRTFLRQVDFAPVHHLHQLIISLFNCARFFQVIEPGTAFRALFGRSDGLRGAGLRNTLLVVFSLAPFFTNSSPSRADELEELRDKFIAEVSSIASIEVRFRKEEPGQIGNLKLTPTGEPPPPRRYTWAKQGEMELLTLDAWENPKYKGMYAREWKSYDGQKGYNLYFDPHAPDEIQTANILATSLSEEIGYSATPGMLIGLRVWGSPLTLVDLFKRPAAKYMGKEDIDGHACHLISFGEYEGYDDKIRAASIWIDVEHGYLPRKVMFQELRNRKTGEMVAPVTPQWVVKEFMRVSDPLRKSERWFPKLAAFGWRESIEIEIESVSINTALPRNRFTPELPLGTGLLMHDQPVPVPGGVQRVPKVGLVGGEAGIAAQNERLERARQRKEVRDTEALMLQEKASRARRMKWYALTGIGFVLIVLGCVVAWRRRSRHVR